MTAVANLSSKTVAVIVIAVMVGLFLVILANSLYQTRRRARATGGPAVPGAEAAAAPTRAGKPVSRREFFRGGLISSVMVFAAQFGGASIAFLWPNLKGGFGSVINAGSVADVKGFISSNRQPFYYGAGRFYIVPYNGNGANTVYQGITADGLMALYQKCVHLGCRVPFCVQSQWFECPCHGSKYNEAGEYQLGPAPTGLNRFKVSVSAGQVMVDTSNIIPGPPRGTNTTHQSPEGPFCV